MIKLYSKSCEYILRIVSQIPQEKYDQTFLARNLCRESRVPEYSARKGLQLLVQQKVLEAIPGPGGGYKFAIHPIKIPLLDIVDILDGRESLKRCIMGLPNCNSNNPCPMHNVWKGLREKVIREFRNKSLFDLMKRIGNE